jgi:hypothetical protein
MKRGASLLLMTFLLSCNNDEPAIRLNAKDCSIESTETSFLISELILFSKTDSLNEKKIPVSGDFKVCNLLDKYNIKMENINLISVIMGNSKNESKHIEINRAQLDQIGKDTLLLIEESIQ